MEGRWAAHDPWRLHERLVSSMPLDGYGKRLNALPRSFNSTAASVGGEAPRLGCRPPAMTTCGWCILY